MPPRLSSRASPGARRGRQGRRLARTAPSWRAPTTPAVGSAAHPLPLPRGWRSTLRGETQRRTLRAMVAPSAEARPSSRRPRARVRGRWLSSGSRSALQHGGCVLTQRLHFFVWFWALVVAAGIVSPGPYQFPQRLPQRLGAKHGVLFITDCPAERGRGGVVRGEPGVLVLCRCFPRCSLCLEREHAGLGGVPSPAHVEDGFRYGLGLVNKGVKIILVSSISTGILVAGVERFLGLLERLATHQPCRTTHQPMSAFRKSTKAPRPRISASRSRRS